ncbi:hypothetical protein P3S68_023920 [Capsicum galapagoense]
MVKYTKVYSARGWVKYNTDGASRGNRGLSSYAFCLRDEHGDIVYAEAAKVHETTNTVTEALAVLKATTHCKKAGYNQAFIQTDSMLIKRVLNREWECPWYIADIVADIEENIQGKQIIIQNIYREGNKLANYLANYALDTANCRYEHLHMLDSAGRKLVNSDKLQRPYLRVSCSKG